MGVKHRNKLRKLGKSSKHRWAMLRNMVTSLIHHERIETTVPKAMELRRVADNMVTLGKRGDQHAKRQANAVVRDYVALHKLFSDLGPGYMERPGGYTRVLKTRNRRGDGAAMAFIEFVDRPGEIRPASRPWDVRATGVYDGDDEKVPAVEDKELRP
jgi:large subunit ribosomal protein L17